MNKDEKLLKIQKKSLEMAKVFVAFCKKNDLLCYLCGGGCIGAVRSGSMIPWDDDLDFFMPREDYEKMIVLWREQMSDSAYVLEKSDSNHVDHNLFVTIRDNRTTMIKPYQEGLNIMHGIALDILPIDGYPSKKILRKIQCFWALLYSLYCAQTIPVNHGKAIRFIGMIGLALVPSEATRYKIWRFAEKQMAKYPIDNCDSITELCSGPMYMKNRYPKEAFESNIYIRFEDTLMPIPVGYDNYLTIAFGDYMSLPPKEKRKPQHDYLICEPDVAYEK